MSTDAPDRDLPMTCGTCGHRYADDTPAGRCPREDEHPDPQMHWTVVGIYDDDEEPVAVAVLPGWHQAEPGSYDEEWWADTIVAATAARASQIAVDARSGVRDDEDGW